jgi:hypothetical protein
VWSRHPVAHFFYNASQEIAVTKFLAAFTLLLIPAFAAEINGKWTAQFDSQIGQQNYTYEFKVEGNVLTGKATQAQRGTTVELKEGKVNGDDISFVEMVSFDGNELRIEYKGKVAGDEIKFRRKVGDFAEYDIVAKRAK